jgi:ABC-type oligopeptide transport system substrate-binding subunit
MSSDLWESPVIHALFEGLTSFDASTGNPVAALATHCHVTSDQLQYTFWLRGHPNPGGIALNAFGRAQTLAHWSDGQAITAHDFVYAWRRAVDPATANPNAYLFSYIANGEAVINGRRRPEELAIRAVDELTLQIRLESPASFLLRLVAQRHFFATPRQAIESARHRGEEHAWTEPERIVTSGAFTLRERRPQEKILLARSTYYDAEAVPLQEILFLPVSDGSTSANLYRTGEAAFSMPMSPLIVAGLHGKKDVRSYRSCGGIFPAMNVTKPPFDDVRVRYAFNMAIDKHAIASFLGHGRTPLSGIVPPMRGYNSPATLPSIIDGTSFDVLSFNPEAARALLARTGHGRSLVVEYLVPDMSEFRLVAEILQSQLLQNLGVELRLVDVDVPTWTEKVVNLRYNGIAAFGEVGGLEDPSWFLGIFRTANASGTGWSDSGYNALLATGEATLDPVKRMSKLADCERLLLESMPCLPLYSDTWVYLCKPFVKGLVGDPFHGRMFTDTWIDTKWTPQ